MLTGGGGNDELRLKIGGGIRFSLLTVSSAAAVMILSSAADAGTISEQKKLIVSAVPTLKIIRHPQLRS